MNQQSISRTAYLPLKIPGKRFDPESGQQQWKDEAKVIENIRLIPTVSQCIPMHP